MRRGLEIYRGEGVARVGSYSRPLVNKIERLGEKHEASEN